MSQEGPKRKGSESKRSRKDVLESYCKKAKEPDVTESSHRRPFLGGFITTLLGVIGIGGSATATPHPNDALQILEDHTDFIRVLVDNGILNEEITRIINNSSTASFSDSSYVRAESLDSP